MTDEFEIAEASYGKADVPVLSWGPDGAREIAWRICVDGAFLDSYRSGDNRAVLPSDTLRRHALAACVEDTAATPEVLGARIAQRLLDANPALQHVTVDGRVTIWRGAGVQAFTPEPWWGTVAVSLTRGGTAEVTSGLAGLTILLTGGSSFTGFLRDPLTEQLDATDRPVLGTVEATWSAPAAIGPAVMAEQLVAALAGRASNSIQQLLTAAAAQLLRDNAALETLRVAIVATALAAAGGGYERTGGPAGLTSVQLRRGMP